MSLSSRKSSEFTKLRWGYYFEAELRFYSIKLLELTNWFHCKSFGIWKKKLELEQLLEPIATFRRKHQYEEVTLRRSRIRKSMLRKPLFLLWPPDISLLTHGNCVMANGREKYSYLTHEHKTTELGCEITTSYKVSTGDTVHEILRLVFRLRNLEGEGKVTGQHLSASL